MTSVMRRVAMCLLSTISLTQYVYAQTTTDTLSNWVGNNAAGIANEVNRAKAAEQSNTTAIQNEAITARNASKLTSGTVPLAQIPVTKDATGVASGADTRIVNAVQPGADLSAFPTTGLGLSRTEASRASDVFNPRDFGAVGDGNSHTVAATLGVSTLASLAAYTTPVGKTPYSWVSSYPYGNLFNLPATQAVAAGATTIPFGTTQTEGLTIVSAGSAASGQNIIPMATFSIVNGDVVSSACSGIPSGATVTNNYGGSISISANLTAALASGCKINFAHASPTTPAVTNGSSASGSTAITINGAPGLDGRLVGAAITGTGIPSGTTVAGLSGNTLTLSQATTAAISNGATLSIQASYKLFVQDAGGLYAGQAVSGSGIASGTQVDWVNPSTLEIGLSKPTTAVVAGGAGLIFTQPWLANVTAGMQVTGAAFPAGETVQSVSAANQTVTLSAATTGAITAATSNYAASPASQSTTITFYAPFTDAQAAALQMDGMGLIAAEKAAEVTGGIVKVPSGTFLLDQTVIFPLSSDPGTTGVGLDGNGIGSTVIKLVSDLGPGRAALSCGDPTGQADNVRGLYANSGLFCPGELRDFKLISAAGNPSVGSRPQIAGVPMITNGFRFGPRKNVRHVDIERFYFGMEGTADWTTWDYAVASNNFTGYRLGDPTPNLFGDLNYNQVFFGGNAFAGISVSPKNGFTGTRFSKSWIADQPHDFWFEPGLPTTQLGMNQSQFDDINFEGAGCDTIKDGNIVDSNTGSNNQRGVEDVRISHSYTAQASYGYTMPGGCPVRAYYDLSVAYGLTIDGVPYNAYPWQFLMTGMIRVHSTKNYANNRGGILLSGDGLPLVMDGYASVCQEVVTGGGGINGDFGTSGSWHLVELDVPGAYRGRMMPLYDTGATTLPRGTILEEVPYSGRTAVQRAGQAAQGTAPVIGTAMADHPSCNMSGKFVPVVTAGQEVPIRVAAATAAGSQLFAPLANGSSVNALPGVATALASSTPLGEVTDANSGSTSLEWIRLFGLGLPAPTANASGLSAAGTTQATATSLTALTNSVTTVASGSGVLLSGQKQGVYNRGANALLVYPPTGAAIESSAVNAAVSISVGGHATFECVSSTQCYQGP